MQGSRCSCSCNVSTARCSSLAADICTAHERNRTATAAALGRTYNIVLDCTHSLGAQLHCYPCSAVCDYSSRRGCRALQRVRSAQCMQDTVNVTHCDIQYRLTLFTPLHRLLTCSCRNSSSYISLYIHSSLSTFHTSSIDSQTATHTSWIHTVNCPQHCPVRWTSPHPIHLPSCRYMMQNRYAIHVVVHTVHVDTMHCVCCTC